jgi:prepilin-type processing-associated H-X9-DG protein
MQRSMPTPTKLHLKRDQHLTITWDDGTTQSIPVRTLRKACPCAKCKELKQQLAKTRLTVLPTTTDAPLAVAEAKLVGNYALNVTWADGHNSGIYSFEYLKSLA